MLLYPSIRDQDVDEQLDTLALNTTIVAILEIEITRR